MRPKFHDNYRAIHEDRTESNGHIFRFWPVMAIAFHRRRLAVYLFGWRVINLMERDWHRDYTNAFDKAAL